MASVRLPTQADVDGYIATQASKHLTLEEASPVQWFGGIGSSISTTGVSYPLFVADYPVKILSLEFTTTSTLSQSNTDYWGVFLRLWRLVGGVATSYTIVSHSTRLDTGAPIASRVPWRFDARTWDPTYRVLNPDDYVEVLFTKFGSAAAINTPYAQMRIAPV